MPDNLVPIIERSNDIVLWQQELVVDLTLDNPICTVVALLAHVQRNVIRVKIQLVCQPRYRVMTARVRPTGYEDRPAITVFSVKLAENVYEIRYWMNDFIRVHPVVIVG